MAEGSYTLTAKAYDNAGAVTTSPAVGVTVTVSNWTKVDDTVTGIVYAGTWGVWNGTGYQATVHYSETTGSKATFAFNGTKARYYGFRRNDLGFAEISVDGAVVASVDCYAGSDAYNVMLYETPVLTAGNHTLSVTVTGTKNPLSSRAWVIVDAFEWLSSGSQQTNQDPTCSITSPVNNETYTAPASITIIHLGADRPYIIRVNDTCHLPLPTHDNHKGKQQGFIRSLLKFKNGKS